MNRNEHGNLTEYDARLGWKGTPNAETIFCTQNARVSIVHNEAGWRDVREAERTPGTPAAVFLGDSFTWGYDVEYEQAFVNRLRAMDDRYEFYNFGHRGYGTDQALLHFEAWTHSRPLGPVFLMFYENDLADNAFDIRSSKNKPRFKLVDDELALTNVPVPPNKSVWKKAAQSGPTAAPTLRGRLRVILFKCHLLHALHRRFFHEEQRYDEATVRADAMPEDAWRVTAKLIDRIHRLTRERGGWLCLVRIPSKGEMLQPDEYAEYGTNLRAIAETSGIDYIDLYPVLKATPLRTYFRDGIHWTAHGHEVVAEALRKYLAEAHEAQRDRNAHL